MDDGKLNFPTIRTSFVERFGEDLATKVEEASLGHTGAVGDVHAEDKWGSDPFRYHVLACIGYECFTRPEFRRWHGITASVRDLREWALTEADLYLHDGNWPDYLALAAGAYRTWIDWTKTDEETQQKWQTAVPEGVVSELIVLIDAATSMLNAHGDWKEGD